MNANADTQNPAPRPAASGPGSWAFLEGLVENLPAGVFAVDAGGRVRVWNGVLTARVAPAKEALGKPLASILPLITDPMRSTDFSALILHGAVGEGKSAVVEAYPRRGPDGVVRLFNVSIAPLNPGAEEGRGAVCLWVDVTASRRKTERDLRNARTSSLASLGASIAHEIRNPLNSIALNLQLLQEGIRDLDCKEREDLIEESGVIVEEIENLNRVVGDLLRFAQKPASLLTRGDASEAVSRALRLLWGEARKAGVRVERHLQPLPDVLFDEDMLSRAIYNMALNAIQAMPEGGTLTVRTEARPHSALIEITDTGPGIPLEEREKIFGLFYSRRPGGTGIGLPITHRIVEAHGGHLTVGDRAEGGAVFQVHLPWAPPEEEAE
ncbi:MAG: two-component system sensor histidine kinase NtrB [Planctomycetota bacterium]